ncbi:hypothetical protein FQA39_LY02962 [Lamprigera yunnana]|nr:hypothetical protein FQA39_LY02962 [Lamprigera yunnana]
MRKLEDSANKQERYKGTLGSEQSDKDGPNKRNKNEQQYYLSSGRAYICNRRRNKYEMKFLREAAGRTRRDRIRTNTIRDLPVVEGRRQRSKPTVSWENQIEDIAGRRNQMISRGQKTIQKFYNVEGETQRAKSLKLNIADPKSSPPTKSSVAEAIVVRSTFNAKFNHQITTCFVTI